MSREYTYDFRFDVIDYIRTSYNKSSHNLTYQFGGLHEAPKALRTRRRSVEGMRSGEYVYPHQQTRGPGERRRLPHRPGRKRF